MWDLGYLEQAVPTEPFNLVLNTVSKKLNEDFLSELALHANSISANVKTVENYPSLRSIPSLKVIDVVDNIQDLKPR